MIKMSFYDGTLNRKMLIAFIESTDKTILYTYGLEYRDPTINKRPISKDEAIRIVNDEGLLDATETEDHLHLNAFSDNDMW